MVYERSRGVCTCLGAGGEDRRQVEDLAERGVCQDTVLHVRRRVVARELEEAFLMIDNKEHNVLLVDALVLEVGFFSVLVISVRIADQGRGSVLFMTIRIQLSGCWWNESWLMSLYSVLSTFLYPSKPPAAPPNLRSRASVAQCEYAHQKRATHQRVLRTSLSTRASSGFAPTGS